MATILGTILDIGIPIVIVLVAIWLASKYRKWRGLPPMWSKKPGRTKWRGGKRVPTGSDK